MDGGHERNINQPFNTATPALFSLLHNHVVFFQVIKFLPVHSLFALAATSKDFKDLVYQTPRVFQYLDLSPYKAARFDGSIDNGGETWRNVQLDENVTEDE